MGRKKLDIARLDSVKARQVKYSKRKVGLLKKAKELSILCDVDVAVVMFSPSGKPTHFVGHDKDISAVLDRFCKLSLDDREQRKAYTMKALEKAYEKLNLDGGDLENHTIDRREQLGVQTQQLNELKKKLFEKKELLRDWKNPYNVESLEKIKIMEDHLQTTLYKLKDLKFELSEREIEGWSF
ncbi:agamous-like MADS-box protein AGL65 [Euphorbia lathyris]|uniref:agamous-like MADS-box protein AGL65 n=1 Tax=Euphorbia lathyris TaxID=212925 RepID=UPI00331316ED